MNGHKATKSRSKTVCLDLSLCFGVLVAEMFYQIAKPLLALHSRRSLDLISYHAKCFKAFTLGIEDDHSALEIVVDAFKTC